MSKESSRAIKSIRKILTNAQAHGLVVDSLSKFRYQEVWASAYALSRLQRAAKLYDYRTRRPFPKVENRELLENLAHYAVFANVAYGWKMDLAFRRRLHLGGDLQALLRRTGVALEDVVAAEWESRTHRPGYYIVRDRVKKKIVLCIRGTWTPHDLLTNLCCTAQDFTTLPQYLAPDGNVTDMIQHPNAARSSYFGKRGQRLRAHDGMLEASRLVLLCAKPILDEELEMHPDYDLVLVGHSMGGGVAALLGRLLENVFPKLTVYVYGPPCVAPLDFRSTSNTKIFSVINEGDPFCCLSLGHVADVSVGLSHLCEDAELRATILRRAGGSIDEMDARDLEWCSQTMQALRGEKLTAEKLFPPGQLLFLSNGSLLGKRKRKRGDSNPAPVRLFHVPPDSFQDLIISPRMFDLTRHVPSLYESRLQALLDHTAKLTL